MTMNVPKIQPVQLEFVFGADSTQSFVTGKDKVDVARRFKLAFWKKNEEPPAPSWKRLEDGSVAFCPGAGYTGTGSLWTRPIELRNAPRLENAIFAMLECRTLNGHFGNERLIGHVRREPMIGEGEDLASFEMPLHDTDDASEEPWHGHHFDVTGHLAPFRGDEAYLTFELKVQTETPTLVAGGCAVRFKDLSLSLVSGGN